MTAPALPFAGVIDCGPEIRIDAAGRKTRNVVILPCGCWRGDVYTRAVLAPSPMFPQGAVHEGWNDTSAACDTHAAAAHVRNCHLLDSVPLTAEESAYLAAADALNAALRALTGQAPIGVAEQLATAVAGRLLPPVAKPLPPKRRRRR